MTKEEINIINRYKRRKNAKLFPIYFAFSWDLLFFYSIEYLFLIFYKHISPSEVLILNAIYLMSTIICNIPVVFIINKLNNKKSIVLANIFLMIFIIIYLLSPNIYWIMLANAFCALGYTLKDNADVNLLYTSLSTKGGSGLFSKIYTKAGIYHYILNGVTAILTGYLFIINPILPVICTLICVGISTILASFLEEVSHKKEKGINPIVYFKNIKKAFKFILTSKRMKALILFQIIFSTLYRIIKTFRSELLVSIEIAPEQISLILGVLTLLGGIGLSLRDVLEKKSKNRTLTFLVLTYSISATIVGITTLIFDKNIFMPIILIMYTAKEISLNIYRVIITKYLSNFTEEKQRTYLYFANGLIINSISAIGSTGAAMLLNYVNIKYSFLTVGLLGLVISILITNYMKSRIGLKPHQYKKEDITF